jgi:hypothetical protein
LTSTEAEGRLEGIKVEFSSPNPYSHTQAVAYASSSRDPRLPTVGESTTRERITRAYYLVMELTDKDIHEFMALWEEEFSESLTMAEARLHASLLLQLYARLVEPYSNPPNQQDHAVL